MSRSRFPSFALILAVLALAAAPALAASPSGNLLPNPDFEAGLGGHEWMPSGWDTSRAGLETVFFGRDGFSAHSGKLGVSVASASALLPVAHHWGHTLMVTPAMWGKDLVLSVWSRNNGVEGRGYVLLQAYRDTVSKMAMTWGIGRLEAGKRLRLPPTSDPLTDLGWQRETFIEVETEWVRREVRVHIPPSTNMAYVRCGLIGTGQVMFDDASLTLEPARTALAPEPGVNLLADPGFEDDQRVLWEYSLPPYPGMRAVRDTTVSHSGRASIRFSGSAGMVTGRAGASQVACNRALSGKRVRMTGWIKTDSLRTSANLKLYCHTGSGMAQESSTAAVYGNMDWKHVVIEMDVPEDTYALWAWMMYSAPTPGVLWFDDAELTVLGPATGQPTPVQPMFEERPAEGAGAAQPPAATRPAPRRKS